MISKDKFVLLHEILKKQAEKADYTKIGKELGISRVTVRKYAKKIGIIRAVGSIKKNTLDLSYFLSIDSPEKAYVLGFIYADGCNTGKALQIGIKDTDKEVLEFIKKQLNSSDKLRFIPKHKPTWSDKYELKVSSMTLSKQLTTLGCPVAKSLILSFPTWIPDPFMKDFIRGYFDGDGSLWYNYTNGTGWHCGFTCGNLTFLETLRDIIIKNTGATGKIYDLKNGYALHFSKREDIKAFTEYMYQDSCFSMSRKKKMYNQFIETFK